MKKQSPQADALYGRLMKGLDAAPVVGGADPINTPQIIPHPGDMKHHSAGDFKSPALMHKAQSKAGFMKEEKKENEEGTDLAPSRKEESEDKSLSPQKHKWEKDYHRGHPGTLRDKVRSKIHGM